MRYAHRRSIVNFVDEWDDSLYTARPLSTRTPEGTEMQAATTVTQDEDKTPPIAPLFYTIAEVAARNRLSRAALRLEVLGGRLKVRRFGRKVLIHIDDEARWREQAIR
jgi:hypothetical protein